MSYKHNKGFTLIEVVVALFIIALVSTPLLQMFVTTSFANKNAQVIDSLNAMAVQKAETFKADPEAEFDPSNPEPVYNPGHPDTLYFYSGNITPLSPNQTFYDLSNIPDGAVYIIKSHLPDPTLPPSNYAVGGYYPDFIGTIDLAQYSTDPSLTITNSNIISVLPALSTLDSTKIKNNVIPIKVDYGGVARTINLTNDSDLEAEFYVFNSNDGSGVNLKTLRGASSIAYVPPIGTSTTKEYDLTLTVYKLVNSMPQNNGSWSDWDEISEMSYSTNRYIYN